MNIKNSGAWKSAQWEYESLFATLAMPLFSPPPSSEEIVGRLEEITKNCPKFYPAVLDMGLRLLYLEGGQKAERLIEKGFHQMLELAKPEHIDEETDALMDNLERLWRFDLSRHYLEILVRREPRAAQLRDSLAHAAVRMGDIEAAKRHIAEALQRKPRNASFWSNKAWIHLIAGELEEAGDALRRARCLRPKDEVIRSNLEIHTYLRRHGGNYFDFLLRPMDRKKIDRLRDKDKMEEADRLCEDYNQCRMESFAQFMILEGGRKRACLPDMLATLRLFFRFVRGVDASGDFMDEDLAFVRKYFKSVMHKFIFKFGDVDREMIEGLIEALGAYYGFLAGRGLVPAVEYKRFTKVVLGMKQELIDKMERYNRIRHDESIDEDKKEAVREELFEGDHSWPHL